jgi:hypothetical protein
MVKRSLEDINYGEVVCTAHPSAGEARYHYGSAGLMSAYITTAI